MKRNKPIFLFALLCVLLIAAMALPVTAHAESGISAKSAVVIDAATGEVVYASNAYERLPMASTTKIMTALIALESGHLDEQFTVDSEAIKVEGSSMGLREGDIVTMRTLVCGMLLPSGNDAANAAAVRISGSVQSFVELMNERAAEMGLEDTHFVTPSGLDDDTDEHYSTAYDMARLAAAALENRDFAAICSQKYIKLSYGNPPYDRWLTNSNKLLGSVDGVIGVKTGFTDKARRCLVSACERNGARLVCVTLNDPDDWSDHKELYDKTFKLLRSVELPHSGGSFKTDVAGGEKSSVTASGVKQYMTLPNNSDTELESVVCMKPIVFAPVEKGEQVGCVRYYWRGELIGELPITVDEDIGVKKKERNEWKKLLYRLESFLEASS